MTTNINKIRDEKLTEDEKMELIADYLENGGGGGSSKLRVKVKTSYVPTAAEEIKDMSEQLGLSASAAAYNVAAGVTFEDENGATIDNATVRAAIIAGNIELIGMDHFGDSATIDGDNVTITSLGLNYTSLPVATNTLQVPGVLDAATALGLTYAADAPGMLPYGISILKNGDTMNAIATIGVVKV